LLGRFFRNVDRFLAIGTANRRLYESYGIPPSRMGSSPYCVDNDRISGTAAAARQNRASLRQKWNIPADAVCFLFCGKLMPKKRIADLLAAFERLVRHADRAAHLLVVGDGEQRSCVQAQVAALLVEGRPVVTWAGFLNQSEVPLAYAAADCLVLPSDATETWGLVVNEAMACGLPAIVSDRVGCGADLIVAGRNGSVFPMADVQALADGLAVWSDRGRCAAAAAVSVRKADEHSIERAADGIAVALDAAKRPTATGTRAMSGLGQDAREGFTR
jgi:glycosyltransferase involved in cell wall biosynthesis